MSYEGKLVSVVIVAAGMGKRMNAPVNKQFIFIKDKPVLAHTINKFNSSEFIDEIIVVVRDEDMDYCQSEIIDKFSFHKVISIVNGGEERQDSVYNGLLQVNKECDVVLIHDGARPFINLEEIELGIRETINHGACVFGVPVKDTIKVINSSNEIVDTPDRASLWAIQTPQCFLYDLIIKAYNKARKEKILATDDSLLVEKLGYKVKVIRGSYNNIKLTTPEDLRFAESILRE